MCSAAMANAMLQDDFKSSHPDLVNYNNNNNDSQEEDERKGGEVASNRSPAIFYKDSSSLSKRTKSVDFAIQAPLAKRTRHDAPWTAKQVVDGTWQRILIVRCYGDFMRRYASFDNDTNTATCEFFKRQLLARVYLHTSAGRLLQRQRKLSTMM